MPVPVPLALPWPGLSPAPAPRPMDHCGRASLLPSIEGGDDIQLSRLGTLNALCSRLQTSLAIWFGVLSQSSYLRASLKWMVFLHKVAPKSLQVSLVYVSVFSMLNIWIQYFALLGVSLDLLSDSENLCGLDVTIFWQNQQKHIFISFVLCWKHLSTFYLKIFQCIATKTINCHEKALRYKWIVTRGTDELLIIYFVSNRFTCKRGKNNIAFITNLKALLIRQISWMDLEIKIFIHLFVLYIWQNKWW